MGFGSRPLATLSLVKQQEPPLQQHPRSGSARHRKQGRQPAALEQAEQVSASDLHGQPVHRHRCSPSLHHQQQQRLQHPQPQRGDEENRFRHEAKTHR